MEDILSIFSNFKADLMKEMGEKIRMMKEEILDKDAVFQKFMQQFENIQPTQKDEVLKMSKEIDGLRLEFGEFQNFVGFLQKQMETVINENVQLRRELSKCNEVIHSWIDSQFQTVQQGTSRKTTNVQKPIVPSEVRNRWQPFVVEEPGPNEDVRQDDNTKTVIPHLATEKEIENRKKKEQEARGAKKNNIFVSGLKVKEEDDDHKVIDSFIEALKASGFESEENIVKEQFSIERRISPQKKNSHKLDIQGILRPNFQMHSTNKVSTASKFVIRCKDERVKWSLVSREVARRVKMEAGVLIFADATPEQIQWRRELYQRKKDMLQIQNTEKDFNVKERGGILYGNNRAYMNMEHSAWNHRFTQKTDFKHHQHIIEQVKDAQK